MFSWIELGYSGLHGPDLSHRTNSLAQVLPKIPVPFKEPPLAAVILTRVLAVLPSFPDSAHYGRVALHRLYSHPLYWTWCFMGINGYLFPILVWSNGKQMTFHFYFTIFTSSSVSC